MIMNQKNERGWGELYNSDPEKADARDGLPCRETIPQDPPHV